MINPPAPRPCKSCPYRVDVPSGIWSEGEYEKLKEYDAPTGFQPHGVFQCHQNDGDDPKARLCAGWAGCHGDDLLSLRLAVVMGSIDTDTYVAAVDYKSPVELFTSGEAAAEHGMRDIDDPSDEARQMMADIQRKRSDV